MRGTDVVAILIELGSIVAAALVNWPGNSVFRIVDLADGEAILMLALTVRGARRCSYTVL